MAVFHVDQTTLKRVNEFCQKHDIQRKNWIEEIVLMAMNAGAINPKEFHFRRAEESGPSAGELGKARETIRRLEARLDEERRKKQPILAPVTSRRIRELPTEPPPPAIDGPPFWEKGKSDGADEQTRAGQGQGREEDRRP